MKKETKNKGFTLIELMITISIIGIIAVVIIPKTNFIKRYQKEIEIQVNAYAVKNYLYSKTTIHSNIINRNNTDNLNLETNLLIVMDNIKQDTSDYFTLNNTVTNPLNNSNYITVNEFDKIC